MKSTNHQDPIKQLAQRLKEHAVPYREGAWEQFNAKQQGKSKGKFMLLWPYFSAAAVLIIAFALFLMPQQAVLPGAGELAVLDEKVPAQSPVLPLEIEGQQSLSTQGTPLADGQERIKERPVLVANKPLASASILPIESSVEIAKHEPQAREETSLEKRTMVLAFQDPQPVIAEQHISSPGEKTKELAANVSRNSMPEERIIPQRTQADFLAELLKLEEKEQATLAVNSGSGKDRWSMELEVSPTMSGNKQVNIGGGLALAYAVSPKLSISSGISYLQLDAERGVSQTAQDLMHSPQTGAVSINVKTKTLEKIQANLVGLDIPLTLNYHINSRVFTRVGISVFSVLNEQGSHQYVNEMAQVSYDKGSERSPEPMVRTFTTKEVTQEKLYEGKSLNGFFNFSVGYAIPISKKVGIAIEPFFKIPMGYVSPDELNLSNGGIKLSTRF